MLGKKKKTLSFLLVLVLLLSVLPSRIFAADFSGHWAESYIQDWINQGHISSYTDGSFRPDKNITRAEFMTIVNNAFNYYNVDDVPFTDVTESDWFYDSVAIAMKAGYINGYPDNTMRPNKTITREEAAVIITNLIGVQQDESAANGFSDSGKMSWSKPFVGAAVNAGVLKGYTDNSFKPAQNMTRAEAVVALTSALSKKIGNSTTPVDPTPPPTTTTPTVDEKETNADVTISTSTYGPSSGTEKITGTVEITSSSSTTVQNININGDLVINKKATGRITLENVSVSGTIIINSSTKLVLEDCSIERIDVDENASKPTITAKKETDVESVYLYSSANLEETDLKSSYKGFKKVYLTDKADEKSTLTLSGDYSLVEINAPKATVTFDKGTIDDLYIGADANDTKMTIKSDATIKNAEIRGKNSSITGSGKIKKADVRATGVTLSKKPDTLTGSYTPDYNGSSSDDTYDVTITVKDGSKRISGATVKLTGISSKTTDSDGEVTFKDVPVKSSSYTCTVTKSGYSTREESVTVSSKDVTKTIDLSESNKYSVTFTVKDDDSGNFIQNASVSIDGQSSTTNSNGKVTFNDVSTGSRLYTVTHSDYTTVDKTYTVGSGSNSITVNMTPKKTSTTYTVTVKVTDKKTGSTINGAEVTFDGDSKTTSGGTASFSNVSSGSKSYSVSHSDYDSDSGKFTVNGNNTLTIQLTPKDTGGGEEPGGGGEPGGGEEPGGGGEPGGGEEPGDGDGEEPGDED